MEIWENKKLLVKRPIKIDLFLVFIYRQTFFLVRYFFLFFNNNIQLNYFFCKINKRNEKDGERRENERDNGNLQIVSHIDNAFR